MHGNQRSHPQAAHIDTVVGVIHPDVGMLVKGDMNWFSPRQERNCDSLRSQCEPARVSSYLAVRSYLRRDTFPYISANDTKWKSEIEDTMSACSSTAM